MLSFSPKRHASEERENTLPGTAQTTPETRSPMCPSLTPAFMAIAPPTVMGMPVKNSAPARQFSRAKRKSLPPVTPAPTRTMQPSASSLRKPQKRMTTPSNKPSCGRTLAPAPRKQYGMRSLSQRARREASSSPSEGQAHAAAVPPQPIEVCRAKSNCSPAFSCGKCALRYPAAVKSLLLLFYHIPRPISNTFQVFFRHIPFPRRRSEPTERLPR